MQAGRRTVRTAFHGTLVMLICSSICFADEQPLLKAGYLPSSANRAIIADSTGGVIAANVAAVKFIFNVPKVS